MIIFYKHKSYFIIFTIKETLVTRNLYLNWICKMLMIILNGFFVASSTPIWLSWELDSSDYDMCVSNIFFYSTEWFYYVFFQSFSRSLARDSTVTLPLYFVLRGVIIFFCLFHGLCKLHGIQVTWQAPKLSHLLYADDMLIFGNLTISEIQLIKHILLKYEEHSGA